MRLFLALNLPKKERQRIERSSRPLRERELPVRWVDIEEYHVTLKFLGSLREARVEAIREIMEKVGAATAAFDLTFGEFGAFPTIRRPEVLWVGVNASPELRCLKQDLEWGLAEHGFSRETRAFHPHITLGRADPDGLPGAFRGVDELVTEMTLSGSVTVRSIDLMQSQLGASGRTYSILESVRLTGEPS